MGKKAALNIIGNGCELFLFCQQIKFNRISTIPDIFSIFSPKRAKPKFLLISMEDKQILLYFFSAIIKTFVNTRQNKEQMYLQQLKHINEWYNDCTGCCYKKIW